MTRWSGGSPPRVVRTISSIFHPEEMERLGWHLALLLALLPAEPVERLLVRDLLGPPRQLGVAVGHLRVGGRAV
jgi:hypothetical protein